MEQEEKEYTVTFTLVTSHSIEKVQLWLTKGLLKLGDLRNIEVRRKQKGLGERHVHFLQLLDRAPSTTRELADASNRSPSQVWRQLKRLEDKGLVSSRTLDERGKPTKWYLTGGVEPKENLSGRISLRS